MIELETLVIKADTNELYTIFLLKKNVQADIIKTILGYLPIVVPETLKEWKIAIISVGQGYESIESENKYKIGLKTTYEGRRIHIDIGKSKNNFNKDGKPRYFNFNIYGYIEKDKEH